MEDQEIWSGFHNLLAGELLRRLNPLIVPKYYADLEVHAVGRKNFNRGDKFLCLGDIDLYATQFGWIRKLNQPFYRCFRCSYGNTLKSSFRRKFENSSVWVDVMTGANANFLQDNKSGEGLRQFRQKRSRLLRSSVHLVELDLLRGGERPGYALHEPPLDTDYIVLVNRATGSAQRLSEIWPVALNEPLTVIPIPLAAPDPDVLLDLNQLIQSVYADAYYELRIDYNTPPPPPKLRPAMVEWRATLQ